MKKSCTFVVEKIVPDVLYDVRYENCPDMKFDCMLRPEENIFLNLFECWQDVVYLHNFFDRNREDLFSGYWRYFSLEDAVADTIEAAHRFQQKILDAAMGHYPGMNLDDFFKPLHNRENGSVYYLQHSKAKERPWLRLYAVRIDSNAYIITGGAIKLTRSMQEAGHTHEELKRIKLVAKFLHENDVI